jgi:hypothetical protein
MSSRGPSARLPTYAQLGPDPEPLHSHRYVRLLQRHLQEEGALTLPRARTRFVRRDEPPVADPVGEQSQRLAIW